MANQELVNYIKNSLSKGAEQVAARKALIGAGWPAADVDEAFYVVGQEGTYFIEENRQPNDVDIQGNAGDQRKTSKSRVILIISMVLFAVAALVYGLHAMRIF